VDTEEIMIKLGFKTDTLTQGISSAKSQMADFGTSTGSSFLHAEREGRMFHTMLQDVTAQSPLLGTALRLAINPITGVMAGATVAFAGFKKLLDDWNKDLDHQAEQAAKPMFGGKDAIVKAAEESQKMRSEFAKRESSDLEHADEEKTKKIIKGAMERAEAEAGGNKVVALQNKIAVAEDVKHRMDQAAEVKALEAKSQSDAMSDPAVLARGERLKSSVSEGKARLEDLKKDLDVVTKAQLSLQTSGNFFETAPASVKAELKLGETPWEAESRIRKEILSTSAVQKQEEEEMLALNKRQSEEQSRLQDTESQRDRARKLSIEMQNEAEVNRAKLEEESAARAEKQAKLDRDMAMATEEKRTAELSAYMPNIKELAGSAPWTAYESGVARARSMDNRTTGGRRFLDAHAGEARELERTEADAQQAFNDEGPQSARFKQDQERIGQLKKGLADVGLQKPDHSNEVMANKLTTLVEMARKEGLVVKPQLSQ
jgi:hypothetical protein